MQPSETVAFTGQPFIGHPSAENVACSKCGGSVHLRSTAWYDTWNDPFKKGGSYVHYGCLSSERAAEIAKDT